MVVDTVRLQEILIKVSECIEQANADDTLHEVLSAIGLQGLIGVDDNFDIGKCDERRGAILVLGDCRSARRTLQAVGENMGYNTNRFKFVAYDDVGRFNFSKIRNSKTYAAVMCGPVPHNARGMGDSTSILEELRHAEKGYPPLVELRKGGGSGKHCINVQTFKSGLVELEGMQAIKPDDILVDLP